MKPRQYTNLAGKKKGRYGADKRFTNSAGSWDSKDEYRRFVFLQDLEKKGTISDLESKVVYKFRHNGVLIASFKPDFRYKVDGVEVVEDFKGNVIPRDFKLRCKMLKAFYGIDVQIVKNITDIEHIAKIKADG